MDRTEGIWRLNEFARKLKLTQPKDIYPLIPGRSGDHIRPETWSHWRSECRPEWPNHGHLYGLIEACIERRFIPAVHRTAWRQAADLVVDPAGGTREQFLAHVDGLPVDPAPPGPVEVCTAATLQDLRGGAGFGRDQVDAFVLRTVDVLRTSCGLSTAGAYAAIRRLLGQEWAFGLARLEWQLGESGRVLFDPADGRFDVLFGTGMRHSFHMVGDAAGPAMREEALHGT